MTNQKDLSAIAAEYHTAIPVRIREYLHGRGIPDAVIDVHLLGWDGARISIPISDKAGTVVSFKFAKDPEDTGSGAKMLASRGARLELYGWEQVLSKPSDIIICEGEFDRLVLEAQGFRAVTSTGGARNFRPEWAADFAAIPEVYICFDRDEAGRQGVLKIGQLIPHAKVVELPEEVGEGGDVTDFFVRLGWSRDDFAKLLGEARQVPPPPLVPLDKLPRDGKFEADSPLRQRIARIKEAMPIADLVRKYLPLTGFEGSLMGRCPFHEDRTPSFAVYPKTGTFYCFGCGKRGDVITFLREIEHLSFAQALDRLEQLTTPHDGEARS